MNIKFIVFLLCLSSVNIFSQDFETILYNGHDRTFFVHIPESYTGEESVPLVVALHGLYRDAVKMEEHTMYSDKSDEEGFIVVYPNAVSSNTGWNEKGSSNRSDDVEFISILIDSMLTMYNIDEDKIYATGFSNGSMMTYRLAYFLADRIAAIGTVAGPLNLDDVIPSRPVPIIHFHARNDGSIQFGTVRPVINKWIGFNNCVAESDTFFSTDGAKGEIWTAEETGADIILYSTKTGGHSWPGGKKSWAEPSKAVSATDLMWEFFEEHPMNVTTSINADESLEPDFNLEQNYPNPFNPTTIIEYQLSSTEKVSIKVYDILGSEVTTLVNKIQAPGNYKIEFDASGLASGLYLYTIYTGELSITKKMIFLK